MMKRGIIFGSIFACILMLLAPGISAIEFKTVTENVADYNENEQFDALKERIEQLKVQNPNPKLVLNGNDPDGPFKGGLDDPTDWVDLFFGIFFGQAVVRFLSVISLEKLRYAYEIGGIIVAGGMIGSVYMITRATIYRLGDAFDIIDPDEDGN